MKHSTYKLSIAYDGTNYSGWQVQPNAPTIQEVIESSLEKLIGTRTKVIASGRTDAGVHAKGQVAHFRTDTPLDTKQLFYKLNCILPQDIAITSLTEADDTFHARFSAKRKAYHYHIHTSTTHSPFEHPYRTHIRFPLDSERMKEAARYFVGTHDFTSFSNENHAGACKKNPIRTIYSLEIIEIEGGISVQVIGNGFLYKMVRNIVGTLLRVGSGKLDASEIPGIFAAKDRTKAPMAASPKGLHLISVDYTS